MGHWWKIIKVPIWFCIGNTLYDFRSVKSLNNKRLKSSLSAGIILDFKINVPVNKDKQTRKEGIRIYVADKSEYKKLKKIIFLN